MKVHPIFFDSDFLVCFEEMVANTAFSIFEILLSFPLFFYDMFTVNVCKCLPGLITQVDLKKKSDDEIAASIKRKLGDAPSISYSEIAKKASEVSRNELAVKVRTLKLSMYLELLFMYSYPMVFHVNMYFFYLFPFISFWFEAEWTLIFVFFNCSLFLVQSLTTNPGRNV